MDNKVALVLGGGGAKGAFQLGVIKRIRELGMVIVASSGTSIGSFNSAFVGANQIDLLESLWLGGQLKNIITKVGLLGVVGSLFTTGSMFDVKTLKKFLLATLNWEFLGSKAIKTSFSFTSLNEKETKYYSNTDSNFNPQVAVDAIVGSMSIPLAYPEAKVLGEVVVDGGFTEIVPVKQVTDMVDPDTKIIIIPCNNTESKVIYKPSFTGVLGSLATLIYAINDILWLEAERDDIANGKAKYWSDPNKFVVVSPVISFIKSAADFDPEAIKAQYAHGYERAKAILG